jgi:hypothetical protein
MTRALPGTLAIAAALVAGGAGAEVTVTPQFNAIRQHTVVVPAGRMWIVQLGALKPAVRILVELKVDGTDKDLGAYLVDSANAAAARQGSAFHYFLGEKRKSAPFRLDAKVPAAGVFSLVLDNRFAKGEGKKVAYRVTILGSLPEEQRKAVKAAFEKAYAAMKQVLEFKNFNIDVKPCDKVNAYSAHATGNVTICTEIIADMANRPGAMAAVFFHELGHTFLNLWGYPNYRNEDDADQFATVMLLRIGESGKKALEQWIQWYAARDSQAEAQYMLTVGDTHFPSVQRIRNIRAWTQNGDDLIRRWNRILYPNMTTRTLEAIVSHPQPIDDPAAAKRELASR